MKNEKVSVIVPLYNYANYIGMCIESVKNQDYDNWELIVVDDFSTDNSYKEAKKYECKNIQIMKMHSNQGYSAAKNAGIISSTGAFIVPLDADDMLTLDSLSVRVSAIENGNFDFVHGEAVNIQGKTTLNDAYSLNLDKSKKVKARIHAQGVIYRRGIHIKYGLYDENLRSRSDKEMWLRLFDKGYGRKDVSKKKIQNIVAYYRIHEQAMHHKRHFNKKLQKKLSRQLEEAYQERYNNINKSNTKFLER